MRSLVKTYLDENINTVDDLKGYLKDEYVIEEYSDPDDFWALYNKLYIIILNCYPIKECRRHRIKFKLYATDDDTYSLPFANLITNMPIWYMILPLWHKERIDSTFVINKAFTADVYKKYINAANELLSRHNIDFHVRSRVAVEAVKLYQEVATDFSGIINTNISLEASIIKPYMSDERIRKIVHTTYEDTVLPSEVIKDIDMQTDLLIEAMKQTNDVMYTLMVSGINIKRRQVQEIFINYGQIPDIFGNLIVRTLNGNGMTTGYNKPSKYYIAGSAARMAAIVNNEDMGRAGYDARNIWILARTLMLSHMIHECGTKHMLKYEVKSVAHLAMIHNKYVCRHWGDPLFVVDRNRDTSLIGETIFVRSVAYCALGEEVCHVCYGEDYKLVEDLPGMATMNAQAITEPISQNILSFKHLVAPNIDDLELDEVFNKYFLISRNEIIPGNNIENLSRYSMMFPVEAVSKESNSAVGVEQFCDVIADPTLYVYDYEEKIFEKTTIGNVHRFLFTQYGKSVAKIKKFRGEMYYEIPFEALDAANNDDDAGSILMIEIKNNGVVDMLNEIREILISKAAKFPDIDTLLNYLVDRCISAKINCRLVQIEVIINRLIRDVDNLAYRPNFYSMGAQYKILSVSQAIRSFNNPLLGLSFEKLKPQLLDYATFEKDGQGYLEPLFQTDFDMADREEDYGG